VRACVFLFDASASIVRRFDMCCSALQYVCCTVLQYIAACGTHATCVAGRRSVLHYCDMCCSVCQIHIHTLSLSCCDVCCSALQCAALCCTVCIVRETVCVYVFLTHELPSAIRQLWGGYDE